MHLWHTKKKKKIEIVSINIVFLYFTISSISQSPTFQGMLTYELVHGNVCYQRTWKRISKERTVGENILQLSTYDYYYSVFFLAPNKEGEKTKVILSKSSSTPPIFLKAV